MNYYGLGKAGILRQEEDNERKNEQLKIHMKEKTKRLKEIYGDFQKNMQDFAGKYKDEINKNPYFRDNFNKLCNELGVDPFVGRKTIWSDLGFGDFYNQLGMRILDICTKKRSLNGGLMKIDEIIDLYNKHAKDKITRQDIERAIKTLSILGSGCSLFKNEYVCTVPFSLSDDSGELMGVAEECGFVSYRLMQTKKGWIFDRFKEKIELLIKEGLVWMDRKAGKGEIHYYFPSMMNDFVSSKTRSFVLYCFWLR